MIPNFKNYRSRFLGACLLWTIVFLAALLYAVIPAIEMLSEHRKLRAKLIDHPSFENILPDLIKAVERHDQYLFEGSEAELQLALFGQVSGICDSLGLRIMDFEIVSHKIIDDWKIVTNRCTISAGFKDLIPAIYHWDKVMKKSKVNSSTWVTKVNPHSRKKELICDLYFQSVVEMGEDEKKE